MARYAPTDEELARPEHCFSQPSYLGPPGGYAKSPWGLCSAPGRYSPGQVRGRGSGGCSQPECRPGPFGPSGR